MRLAERVERAILARDPSSPLGRARLKAAIEARRLLVRLGDPTVRYRVGDVDLELPLSHQLPFFQHAHPAYDTAIAGIAAEADGPVVDIGANVGDTAAAIRTGTDVPILCIEGDDRFFALLTRNADHLGDVELAFAFVAGGAHGESKPRSKSLARILEDHPRFAAPALLKLDTDGMDVPILRANLDLLARVRPTVFFEYDPHLGAEPTIFEQLADAGYRTADWYENTGTLSRTVQLPDHLHDEYVGHGGARYADVCVRS